MTDYNAIGEVPINPTARRAEAWMDALASYSPAVARTERGASELVITVPAKTFDQAVTTAYAVLTRAAGQLQRFEVLTTAEFDRRSDDVRMPDLVGATEAAEIIGITRQRVQQLAAIGQLQSVKVGSTYAFVRSGVEAIAAARAGGKTVNS